MSEEKETWVDRHYGIVLGLMIASPFILVGGMIIGMGYINSLDDEQIVVEGKIIGVEYLGKGELYFNGDAFNITFDDGESYIIETGIERDFTVNSKFIIKLHRTNSNSHWIIRKMYKVPSED